MSIIGIINEILIYFVAQNIQIVLDGQLRQSVKLVASENRSGRIVRVAEKKSFCPRRDEFFELLNIKCPVFFFIERNKNGNSAGNFDGRLIGSVGRIGNQNLVARLEESPEVSP